MQSEKIILVQIQPDTSPPGYRRVAPSWHTLCHLCWTLAELAQSSVEMSPLIMAYGHGGGYRWPHPDPRSPSQLPPDTTRERETQNSFFQNGFPTLVLITCLSPRNYDHRKFVDWSHFFGHLKKNRNCEFWRKLHIFKETCGLFLIFLVKMSSLGVIPQPDTPMNSRFCVPIDAWWSGLCSIISHPLPPW